MNMSLGVLPLILLAVLHANLSAADRPGKAITLGGGPPLRTGTLVREKRELRIEAGKTKQEIGKEVTNVTTRYLQSVHLMRRMIGNEAEEVQVREFVKECAHFMMGTAPPPDGNPSTLSSKNLRFRRKSGHWSYEMMQGSPTPEEAMSMAELAFAADLLEVIPTCIGTGSHKLGESWKTQMDSPRGKAYGWIAPDQLESTLVATEDKADGPHATIAINGKFRMERPMNFNARMEITFSATVVRRLTDMIDVDTKITGQFVAVAAAIADKSVSAKNETIILNYDYPFTLTRTLKIEPK